MELNYSQSTLDPLFDTSNETFITVEEVPEPTSEFSIQQKALAIAPKFTATLSIIGSSLLILMIVRKNNRMTLHNLILGMSICDLSASTAWFFTTWPIPSGTPNVYGAVGTQQTCTAQAFFAQFSLSTVMYNASMAIYYVLIIKFKWKPADVRKVEPLFHIHALSWGVGTAFASIYLTLFNQVGWDCWISAHPLGCKESWKNNGITTCTRGDNGSLYQWVFYYAPLWIVIILDCVLMSWIYFTVRKQESRLINLSANRKSLAGARSTSINVQTQAYCYIGAFLVTWFWPTVFQAVLVTKGTLYDSLLFLTAISVPIQGFFNLLVYIRPKYARNKRPNQNPIQEWIRITLAEVSSNEENKATIRTMYNESRKINNNESYA